jgi:hypothetical protein
MDVFGAVTATFAIVPFGYDVLAKAIAFATSVGSGYRHARFGLAGNILYFTRLVDTERLQEMHWNINHWTNAEVLAWRDSYVATCNAVAVAAAIFASIGLTALSLPDMYTVHWSARALCVASMVLGVLSVTTATSQQQRFAMLNDPTSIRLWLSLGRPSEYGFSLGLGPSAAASYSDFRFIQFLLGVLVQMRERKPRGLKAWVAVIRDCLQQERRPPPEAGSGAKLQAHNKYKELDVFKDMPLESSISVLKTVAAPRHLLDLAVLLYIVGFGLYLLFLWIENMGGQPEADRNVFIVFILSAGVFLLYYNATRSGVLDNQTKKAEEFDLQNLGKLHKPKALEQLENELRAVQERMKTLSEQQITIETQMQEVLRSSEEGTATRNGNVRSAS